ncbi:unnamed protein product [Striga asiatica]|uniref:Uncharacterized protein n=1 Tax=Striga asiatica TaxID=4170 RepID=A0A5A7QIF2_STRAF|nr:unnamed protein product [Striga asiatica]
MSAGSSDGQLQPRAVGTRAICRALAAEGRTLTEFAQGGVTRRRVSSLLTVYVRYMLKQYIGDEDFLKFRTLCPISAPRATMLDLINLKGPIRSARIELLLLLGFHRRPCNFVVSTVAG